MSAERKTATAALDRDVRAVIARYGFSEKAAVSLLSESENRVYLIDDPDADDRYVLRVNSGRLGYHTPASIASELMWLRALGADTDILVPRVRQASDGSLVQTLVAPDLGKPRHVAVYSFLAGGEPPEDALEDGFRRLGGLSAQMHSHSRRWTPPADFHRHTWSPQVILDDRLNWGAWRDGVGVAGDVLAVLTRLEDVVRRRLAALPTNITQHGLIHADLRLANLLVDGERTAIIDFDDCGHGWYLYELAGALSFLEERADAPALVAAWLDGYREVAPVPAESELELPSLIMLRRLQLMGWVGFQQQHLEFARDIGPRFTADSCRLAEDYLQRFG